MLCAGKFICKMADIIEYKNEEVKMEIEEIQRPEEIPREYGFDQVSAEEAQYGMVNVEMNRIIKQLNDFFETNSPIGSPDELDPVLTHGLEFVKALQQANAHLKLMRRIANETSVYHLREFGHFTLDAHIHDIFYEMRGYLMYRHSKLVEKVNKRD